MPLNKKPMRFHNLKRPKIRADMRKENLYKLAKQKAPFTASRTFFQQKWTAKSLSRAYHGQHIREKQWVRMFDRRTNAVVPMSPGYLATHDGSDQAAGRGSGRQQRPGSDRRRPEPGITPYMQMVYHPIERRLDFAIFRSLFAPSAKQAKQLVLHGAVKVNGKPMQFPGYLLNPGDMFQVTPERVMYCMGKRRTKGSVIRNKRILSGRTMPRRRARDDDDDLEDEDEEVQEAEETESREDALLAEEQALAEQETAEEVQAADPAASAKKTIKSLTQRTKGILDEGKAKKTLSGKQKQDFRALLKSLRSTMSRAASATPSMLEDLEAQYITLSASAAPRPAPQKPSESETPTDKPADKPADKHGLTSEEETDPAMRAALDLARENPIDNSKPYATPWKPRRWMSAFAFIPRYLEVNQNICAAVYLRHPVCYPGFAEVPTPFHPETGQLAHAWYLRRR